MAIASEGIRVRLTMDNHTSVTGFASGAESPNDFWAKFRTQLVRLDDATLERADGATEGHPTLYVNRDRILLVAIVHGSA